MTTPTQSAGGTRPRPVADLVITGTLLVLFATSLLTAQQWTFRAALFPRMVTVLGLVLVVLHLVILLARPLRRASADPDGDTDGHPAGDEHGESSTPDAQTLMADDEADIQEIEYAYASASGRSWATNLGWVAAFFFGAWLIGLFYSALFFTVLYLRFGAERSWRLAVIYGLAIGAVLLAFDQLLQVAMPIGVFLS